MASPQGRGSYSSFFFSYDLNLTYLVGHEAENQGQACARPWNLLNLLGFLAVSEVGVPPAPRCMDSPAPVCPPPVSRERACPTPVSGGGGGVSGPPMSNPCVGSGVRRPVRPLSLIHLFCGAGSGELFPSAGWRIQVPSFLAKHQGHKLHMVSLGSAPII